MSSYIPLALSLLQAGVSSYQSNANPTSTGIPPGNGAPSAPAPSNPVNVPGSSSKASTNANAALSLGVSPPNGTSTSNLCETCHSRQKHYDAQTGKTHPYCSKTCASNAKGSNTKGTSGLCEYCKTRPKYQDWSGVYPYCGKICASNASKASASQKRKNTLMNNKGTCLAPGCQNQPHSNPDGTVSNYCSQAHKTLGESICLMCRQDAKQQNSHFCSKACIDQAEKNGPMVLEVPEGHVTFKSVADQFAASWRHPGTVCPPVRRIYKILSPQASLASYNAYKASVEKRGNFVAAGRTAGNENRRWHGTRRECNFGDKGNTKLCSSPTCSLCCIIRTSFDLSLWGKKTGWGRFGKGIYTSSTSSKSNDYSSNDCKSPYKAILLNKVIVGKGCKMLMDNTTLTAPPPGYDSVLAEKGGSLNYDELVVYRNDAIRPSYLVLYEI